MKRIYFILATAVSIAFTSCTNDEIVGGEDHGTEQALTDAISFGSGFQAVTRASGADAATLLGNAFKVYGVKSNRTTPSNYDKVFSNYIVKYSTEKQGNTEYNGGWYYDGAETGQTIRYWDYASANYHFVAGSPDNNFTFALKEETTKDIEKATVTGLGGRLNHSTTVASNAATVYIADPVVMTKPTGGAKYGEVMFTFHSMQSKVRVGIYETIPGYKITEIKFYQSASATTPDNDKYITLIAATDYFQGGSGVEGTVTYNWTTPGYTLAYSTEDSKKPTLGKYWEGGQFTSGVPATTSAATNLYGSESHMATDGYFIVMPTPSTTEAAPLTLKCDYVLKSLDDVDEIHVTGATATIPETYTKWAPNTAYTYIFKISNNTNGSTGNPDSDPAGLYPITFDAAVVDIADQKRGTETTVSTPSITCCQNGDVIAEGIKFIDGADITVKTSVAATITVQKVNGNFNYGKSYDQQSYDTTFGTKTLGTNVTSATFADGDISDNTTYVIKAATDSATAYFVLVVGAAENGPENPTNNP